MMMELICIFLRCLFSSFSGFPLVLRVLLPRRTKKWKNEIIRNKPTCTELCTCGKLTRAYTKKFEEELWTQPWKFEIYETAIIHHRLAMSWDHEIISFITVMQADTLLPRISYEELYDAFIENILNFVVILHL